MRSSNRRWIIVRIMEVSATYLLQLMLNGLMLGLIYALIAVGLALIFGVLEVINFAHGEFLMLGGYAMALALPRFGLSYWPALVVAVLTTSLVGMMLYEFFLRHIGQKEFERSILTTLGISMILLFGMQYLFTATPLLVDTSYGFDGVEIGAIRITTTRLIAAGLSIAAFSGLYVLLKFTQFGRSMRAISQNREAAMMVGIKPRHVARNAVALAAALCGLAGAALAPIQLLYPAMGQAIIFKAFALVVIGGLGNMTGAVVTAIALGLIESWVGGFFGIVWQEGAIFSIMIVAVLVRPNGIFQRSGMRVG